MHSSDSTSDMCVCVSAFLWIWQPGHKIGKNDISFSEAWDAGLSERRDQCVCRVSQIQQVSNGKVITCPRLNRGESTLNTLRQICSSRTGLVFYILAALQYVNYFYFFQNPFLFFFPRLCSLLQWLIQPVCIVGRGLGVFVRWQRSGPTH